MFICVILYKLKHKHLHTYLLWQAWWLWLPYSQYSIPESHAYGVLFHSWYVMLQFVRNMKIFCSEDIFWFQSYWSRNILHGNFRLLFVNYMVVIHTLFTNLTQRCHICWRVVHQLWHTTGFQLCCSKPWRVPHVGQEILTLSGTPDFTSFWGVHDFTHSLYIHYILLNLTVLGLCLRVNDWFVGLY